MMTDENSGGKQNLKSKTAFFIGDDQFNRSKVNSLKMGLDKAISALIKKGVVCFGCASLSDFGLLARQAVMNARAVNPAVKLILVLPFSHQYRIYARFESHDFESIQKSADRVRFVSEKNTPGCLMRHTLHLISHSGYCVAYVRHAQGETSKVVDLARENGLDIIELK